MQREGADMLSSGSEDEPGVFQSAIHAARSAAIKPPIARRRQLQCTRDQSES
jgi:hypothetical protein